MADLLEGSLGVSGIVGRRELTRLVDAVATLEPFPFQITRCRAAGLGQMTTVGFGTGNSANQQGSRHDSSGIEVHRLPHVPQ